jgi:general secretion pathway protein K
MSAVGNSRGVAIVLVLLVLGVMIPLTLDLNRASRAQVYEAANLADGIRSLHIAKSGYYLGKALLEEDDASVDTLNESWARAEVLSAQSSLLFSEGMFLLKIEDESGKIPINGLVEGNEYDTEIRGILTRLLSLPGFRLQEGEVRDLVDALKDWMDSDDEPTGFGAESSYYRALETPCSCKNGPLDRIEELRLVRGVTRELFEGTADRLGLRDYVTVFGNGSININTAPLPVLMALSETMDEERAAALDAFRKDSGHDLSKVRWYKEVTGMTGIALPSLVTVQSSVFRLRCVGNFRDVRKRVDGILQRGEGGAMQLLSWRET